MAETLTTNPEGAETMTTPLTNLIADQLEAKPGLDRIIAANQGDLTERITRLAALSTLRELQAAGYSYIDSAGPAVLAYRPVQATDRRHRALEVIMAGPTGTHRLNVTLGELHDADNVIVTGRVRAHWLGFIANNGVEVPRELEADADRQVARERSRQDVRRRIEAEEADTDRVARLRKAFDAVSPALHPRRGGDWKDPIDHTILATEAVGVGGVNLIREAIQHFTATVAEVHRTDIDGARAYRFEADGYRAGPAGDH